MHKKGLYSQPSYLEMDLGVLTPVPQYETACGGGFGVAACPSLGLLVTSDVEDNTLSVWSLPSGAETAVGSGLALVCTLGGKGSPAPMQFKFSITYGSGHLAFTPPLVLDSDSRDLHVLPHLLLVSDAGQDAVHMIDVVSRAHIGYVAAPGSIAGPRGLAARGNLVAVSAWKELNNGHHVVHVYRAGSCGALWTYVRAIGRGYGGLDGQLLRPCGLRFSGDGSNICVADRGNNRLSMFRLGDSVFVRHIATELDGPRDMEEVEGGWVVAYWVSDTVGFVSDGGRAGGGSGSVNGEFDGPTALALVPGLGLIVREFYTDRLQVFSTPDMLAMWAMSGIRVGWMTATYRAVVHRHSLRERQKKTTV